MAELLSQLPADMNVEYLVLSMVGEEEEEGEDDVVKGKAASTWMGRPWLRIGHTCGWQADSARDPGNNFAACRVPRVAVAILI